MPLPKTNKNSPPSARARGALRTSCMKSRSWRWPTQSSHLWIVIEAPQKSEDWRRAPSQGPCRRSARTRASPLSRCLMKITAGSVCNSSIALLRPCSLISIICLCPRRDLKSTTEMSSWWSRGPFSGRTVRQRLRVVITNCLLSSCWSTSTTCDLLGVLNVSPPPRQLPSISIGNRSSKWLLKRAYSAQVQSNSLWLMRHWARAQQPWAQPPTSRINNHKHPKHSISSRWWSSTGILSKLRIFSRIFSSNSKCSSKIARKSLRTTRTKIWDRSEVFSSRGSPYRCSQPDWPSLWKICKCRQVPISRRGDFRILTAWSRNDIPQISSNLTEE